MQSKEFLSASLLTIFSVSWSFRKYSLCWFIINIGKSWAAYFIFIILFLWKLLYYFSGFFYEKKLKQKIEHILIKIFVRG